MSISKKTIKKIVENMAAWSDGLVYPIPVTQLKSEWEINLQAALQKNKVTEPLSQKNLDRIKSSTIELCLEINKEAVEKGFEAEIEERIKELYEKLAGVGTIEEFLSVVNQESADVTGGIREKYGMIFGYGEDYKTLEKVLMRLEERLVESCKVTKPRFYSEVDYLVMGEINKSFQVFSDNLHLLLQKTTKEQFVGVMGTIEVYNQKLRILVEAEFRVFPQFWLNYYQTLLKNLIYEEWMQKRDQEFQVLHSNFKVFLRTVLEKIKNKELTAFDPTICPLTTREAVCEVLLSYFPREIPFPCHPLDNFLHLLQLPSAPSLDTYLYNKSFIDQSIEKFLHSSEQLSRFFCIISLVLIFSNTYQLFNHTSIASSESYNPIYRQLIRSVVCELFQMNYETILEFKPKTTEWSLVLVCEQEIVNSFPEWNTEEDVISMTDYIRQNYESQNRNLGDRLDDYSKQPGKSSFLQKTLKITSKIVKSVAPSRRIGEFSLERIKGVTSLNTTIVVSGWLSQEDEMENSWMNIISNELQGNTFALRWDSGSAKKLVKKELFSSFIHSVGLIMAAPVVKLAHLGMLFTVNPFKKRAKKAETTGYVLADLIASKRLGNACISLVGFSLGTRVIYFCLQKLKDLGHSVNDVLLLGGAAPLNVEKWTECKKIVTGRLINTYSKTDKILSKLYSVSRLEKAIGNWPLEVDGVENFDVTQIASGHLKYRESLGQILNRVEYFLK